MSTRAVSSMSLDAQSACSPSIVGLPDDCLIHIFSCFQGSGENNIAGLEELARIAATCKKWAQLTHSDRWKIIIQRTLPSVIPGDDPKVSCLEALNRIGRTQRSFHAASLPAMTNALGAPLRGYMTGRGDLLFTVEGENLCVRDSSTREITKTIRWKDLFPVLRLPGGVPSEYDQGQIVDGQLYLFGNKERDIGVIGVRLDPYVAHWSLTDTQSRLIKGPEGCYGFTVLGGKIVFATPTKISVCQGFVEVTRDGEYQYHNPDLLHIPLTDPIYFGRITSRCGRVLVTGTFESEKRTEIFNLETMRSEGVVRGKIFGDVVQTSKGNCARVETEDSDQLLLLDPENMAGEPLKVIEIDIGNELAYHETRQTRSTMLALGDRVLLLEDTRLGIYDLETGERRAILIGQQVHAEFQFNRGVLTIRCLNGTDVRIDFNQPLQGPLPEPERSLFVQFFDCILDFFSAIWNLLFRS
ncbi:MAG: F-box protein [Chlamydiales bacterium]|nr:F-box protein [Chlamydiales bacterium]